MATHLTEDRGYTTGAVVKSLMLTFRPFSRLHFYGGEKDTFWGDIIQALSLRLPSRAALLKEASS